MYALNPTGNDGKFEVLDNVEFKTEDKVTCNIVVIPVESYL